MISLGCRADGKFAATVGGNVLSIPRQVGKTWTVGGLFTGLCLELPGFKCAWTSHHLRTTNNTFQSIQGLVQRKGIRQFLLPDRSDGVRKTNGQQEIRFTNGSLFMFGARSEGFGRGLDELDGEVFDEAQILGLKALEDMIPATNQARNPHGALIFFLGTPPRPTDPGEAFTSKREQALSGKKRNIFYAEFSADPDSEPYDVKQYPIMNPSFPHRTPMEAMERMQENIPDVDSWNREARGIWPAAGMDVIDFELWKTLQDDSVTQLVTQGSAPDRVVLTVAVAQDRSWSCIGVAGTVVVDGKSLTVVFCQSMPGISGVAARVADLQAQRDVVEVALVGPQANALQPDFVQADIEFRTFTGTDEASSCSSFQEAVKSRSVLHVDQVQLNKAVKNARTRMSGESERWDRKDVKVDDSPLVAVAGAFYRWGLLYQPNYDVMESIL